MAEPGPNFLIELFSEEIPAGLQASGAETLRRLLIEALAPLAIRDVECFSTPRRIALAARLNPEVAAQTRTERGPRESAPEQALAGFLRKHDATREALHLEGSFWMLRTQTDSITAATLVARTLPALLRRFPWPKAMRWSATSQFTWVRPLRRILCVLDGKPVRFGLTDGDDDGHGLIADSLTEGHRFLAPGAVAVTSLADWRRTLRVRHVLVDPRDRATLIREGIASLARAENLTVAPDDALLEEVAGLVEWPVPMLGTIDAAFMDLPPEVMQVSMGRHQRYFALRTPDGAAAPRFAFIAGSIQSDDAALAITGNERVLRARFSDARHFWDLDRATSLEARVGRLEAVRFHAALGVIRIIRDNALRLDLHALFAAAAEALPEHLRQEPDLALLPAFIAERLRVQLRTEGARHDVLAAVNAAGHDGDLVRLLARTDAVANLLDTAEGADLLAACRRAANILRIEDRKDGPHAAPPTPALYAQDEERALAALLDAATPEIDRAIAAERYDDAMTAMAAIRAPLDRFFEAVTVNADNPALRRNRLKLLAALRDTFGRIADLGLIES